jgi:Zn finger protein HypA/HybF involved in hydrogenase expression
VGRLAAVDPDALTFCFDALKADTPLASANLAIEWLADDDALDVVHLEFDVEFDAEAAS